MIDRDFWKGKRVFLTGHTGFKGGWLSLWLQRLGAELTGYSLQPPTDPSLFELAAVADGMESVIADVRDLARLTTALDVARPKIVFHMAAQPLVRYSYKDPIETYTTNVIGTANLLEAVRRTASVRAVVVITTDKCYDNKEWVWSYREVDRLGGYDPYSSSKACTELVVAAYRDSFFNLTTHEDGSTAVASARAGNVIGGGDWAADRLVPDLVRAFLAGQPAPIRNPESIRPWQHVLEPSSGYLLLAQKLFQEGPSFAEAWNFAPRAEDSRPVAWVADRMTQEWGDSTSWTHDLDAHPHESRYLSLDWSKARSRLGWSPLWRLEEALQRVVTWYREYSASGDAGALRQITLDDIAAYEAELR